MKHTIFTPVFNRSHQMMDLAKHISEIEYNRAEFEWIIVDDGSTDNLKEVFGLIQQQYPELNIKYIYKENGGIHTAQNCAIVNANGEYVTRIDSDDYLLPDCLINYDKALDSIPSEKKEDVAGVVGLCLNLSDKTVRGTYFPIDYQITKGYLLRKQKVSGDRNYCMKTSVMKEHLIPEYPDTKWVPEGGVLWLEIDKQFDTVFVNIPFSVCTEPNPNSYLGSMKKITLSNCMSIYYGALYEVNFGKGYYSFINYLKAVYKLSYAICCAKTYDNTKYNFGRLFSDVKSVIDKIMVFLSLPLAIFKSRNVKQ